VTGDASFAFTYAGVHAAPDVSGLYTIFSPRRWVYIGESDDIRRSLYELLNDSSVWMNRFGPLSFSFERMSGTQRATSKRRLVEELKPARHSGQSP
jgi:hypothetical protein